MSRELEDRIQVVSNDLRRVDQELQRVDHQVNEHDGGIRELLVEVRNIREHLERIYQGQIPQCAEHKTKLAQYDRDRAVIMRALTGVFLAVAGLLIDRIIA